MRRLTLLLFQLTGTSGNFVPLLGLVGSLPLVGQVLLNVQVDGVLVRLYLEDLVRKFHLAARVLSFYI